MFEDGIEHLLEAVDVEGDFFLRGEQDGFWGLKVGCLMMSPVMTLLRFW